MLPLNREKARALTVPLLALTVAVSLGACSKPATEANKAAQDTIQETTSASKAAEKKKPSPTLAGNESPTPAPKEKDPQDLTERNPEDFVAADSSSEYVTTYAVNSPDGDANCYFMDKPGQLILNCLPNFTDPPMVFNSYSSQWEAAIIQYSPERGFYPEGDIRGAHPPASYTVLNPNETVKTDKVTFTTDKSGALTVAVDNHFMVFDHGSYRADNYPPQRGVAGSTCGQVTFPHGETVNVYATKDGTDCDSALAAVTKYADPNYPKQGNRGYATIDGWECVPAAPSGWLDIPQNRLLFSTNGEQQVVAYRPFDRVISADDQFLRGPFKTE